MWIDTHCHLDAPEFDADRFEVRQRARELGVALCVWPAVRVADFDRVRQWASGQGDAYALGIHPLCAPQATDADLQALDEALSQCLGDPHLVAVGEIGLDGFVPECLTPQAWARQCEVYEAQLRMAKRHGLPVIVHVRQSADQVLKGLRRVGVAGGLAHAFNGSVQQAQAFVQAGFALGFGGAMSHERALHLRRLARELPITDLVLETDSPDMPPQWLYVTAERRAAGEPQGRNEPGQLPRIAEGLAQIRAMPLDALARVTTGNAVRALPRLGALLQAAPAVGAR